MLPEVREVELSNGFRALLIERSTLPIVSSMVWYSVGSRDERSGETGLSHFLEHMMFKGTNTFGKGPNGPRPARHRRDCESGAQVARA